MTDAGALLWEPSRDVVEHANITRFTRWLTETRGLAFEGYDDLWRWSVTELEAFWDAIGTFSNVRWHERPSTVLRERTMPGARWFPGGTLNYAEHLLAEPDDRLAVIHRAEGGRGGELTRRELTELVARVASGLRRLGVGRGDRVAAYLPNGPEALIALLATASVGAIWSSCSPEFGTQAVTDRFAQIEPKVLIAVDGYRYAGTEHDRREVLREIVRALPGLERLVVVPTLFDGVDDGAMSWDELASAADGPLAFEAVRFDHPLWILYSSGTTGLPKAMVQGHGGILLEHLKALAMHQDLGPEDRFFWFTTTGWMMWNYLVSALALGTTIVLYDGSPAYPGMRTLWKLAGEVGITSFGTSAPFIHACMKTRVHPSSAADLSALRTIGSTGAPLSPEGFEWVYREVREDLWLGSMSGGTDLCTAFVGSNPTLPVHAGELQCRCLGASVEAFDADGRPVIDDVGELVITQPMPSMPVSFWGDADGERYRSSYFETYPGVWRHGDWIRITERGSCVITGRSDATLNRGGVRLGTSELYRLVEMIPGVIESLVVDTSRLGSEGELQLFVVLEEGTTLDDALRRTIDDEIRTRLSPRHVPDRIEQVRAIPKTLNGKRLEVPVKRLLLGDALEEVASPGALADPEALRAFADLAAERGADPRPGRR
jgi:acetoacetyl-CoA synthetase